MYEDLIVRRTVAELRQSAEEGLVYFCCERFEDRHGRLVIGIGARLEGKALSFLSRSDRKAILVSPVPIRDGIQFRQALRKVEERDAEEEKEHPLPEVPGVWDRISANARKAVGEAMLRVLRLCPELVRLIQGRNPYPSDLLHGVQVAACAGRAIEAFNRQRERGTAGGLNYSQATREEVFLAGLVHDIGRWRGGPMDSHGTAGARVLKDSGYRSPRLRGLADIIGAHHDPLSAVDGGLWEAHRKAPVALAEAVMESPSVDQALCRLAGEGVNGPVKGLLIGLCDAEGILPPGAVVQVNGGSSLAVSLRGAGLPAPSKAPACAVHADRRQAGESGSLLLRFAGQDSRGYRVPLLHPGREETEALPHLMAPDHPAYRNGGLEVVDLLPPETYDRLFARYECLIPAFRERLMEPQMTAGPRTTTSESRGREPGERQENLKTTDLG